MKVRRTPPTPTASEVLRSRSIGTPSPRRKKKRLRSAPASGRADSRVKVQQPDETSLLGGTPSEPVTVPSPEQMPDDTFFKHFNARHLPDVLNLVPIRYSPTMTDALVRTFRAYHRRMHRLHDHYDHVHLED